LNFATIGNNNYGREAAAFFKTTNYNNYGREARSGRLFENKIMGLFWTIGNHKSQLGPRSGRFLKFCINWEQKIYGRDNKQIKTTN
jgi:hypothetical protein